jgi:hypothetical protein
MKKNRFIKIITVIILWIAAFSLVFGSAIMLLGNTNTENTEIADNWEYTGNEINEEVDEELIYDISAEDNNTEVEISE